MGGAGLLQIRVRADKRKREQVQSLRVPVMMAGCIARQPAAATSSIMARAASAHWPSASWQQGVRCLLALPVPPQLAPAIDTRQHRTRGGC
mmetsp:Transcript_9698/g.30535  ORF Transcript_9698/g.30535 Transcript_9698/m.30535 type:complete len:91 (+) Transcript_9698:55-327(+)